MPNICTRWTLFLIRRLLFSFPCNTGVFMSLAYSFFFLKNTLHSARQHRQRRHTPEEVPLNSVELIFVYYDPLFFFLERWNVIELVCLRLGLDEHWSSATCNWQICLFLGGHKEFHRRHRELCEDALLPGAAPPVFTAAAPSLEGQPPLGSPVTPAG